jgi:hypothetical protein
MIEITKKTNKIFVFFSFRVFVIFLFEAANPGSLGTHQLFSVPVFS